MSLKNIYNREDFKKVYEIFGGTHGGAGNSDGFANNAKLKDTYLGMLLNSMFKGISWLWRKSKENFIINKMIGRLINELMRGVVVYCLINDIDLKTGKKNEEIEGEAGEEIESDEEKGESYKTKPVKEWTIEDYDNASKEWSIEKLENEISLTRAELNDLAEIDKINLEKSIEDYTTKLSGKKLSPDIRDTYERNLKNAKEQLIVVNKQIEFNKQLLPILEKNLAEKRNVTSTETGDEITNELSKPNLKPIHDACVKKYNFNVDSDKMPKIVQDMKIINPIDFKQRYERISPKLILIGDVFVLKYGRELRNVKINDVDVKHGTVNVTSIDNLKAIENKKFNVSDLRPESFPNYLKVKKSIDEYLHKYANKYSNLSDIDRQDMEKIYMVYSYLNKLIGEYEKTYGVVEDYYSYDFEDYDIIIEGMLYEFDVKDTYNKSKEIGDKEITNMGNPIRKAAEIASVSKDVKIKPGEPKAGKISGTKSISQMAVSPTVGDILTKRDKEKYKDRAEDFDIKIYDINLAEIEKTVESDSNVKLDVAKCVNPYNLKVIQITIKQLFEPSKTAEVATSDNTKLKLKWDKKVDNVYASFYKIMDTIYISKIMESASSITVGKEFDKAIIDAGKINDQKKSQEIAEKLPLDVTAKDVNLESLKTNGYYCWYNFSYKKENHNTVITPVTNLFNKDVPLFQISPFFDVKDGKIVIDAKKMDKFKSIDTNISLVGDLKIKVYFLLYKNQVFPHSSTKLFSIFVINEIESNSGKKLFLLANKGKVKVGEKSNFLINDELLKDINDGKINIDFFKYTINSIVFDRFDKSKFDKDVYKVGELLSDSPESMKNDDIINVLKQLSAKLS